MSKVQTANAVVTRGLRSLHGLLRMVRARVSGKSFFCNALAGRSGYNICVNSDMSVSCNCQDFDGSGHIGDLRTQDLDEVFRSEPAQRLRSALAAGRLPLSTCDGCSELREVPLADAGRHLLEFTVPTKGLMVENTVACNLACAGCFRRDVMKIRRRRLLTLDDVRRVAEVVAKHRIESVCYFNLGEPFLSKTIAAEIEILRERNPGLRILISTNGAMLEGEDKKRAALAVDHLAFSIDGSSQETVERYQVGGDFDRSYSNMKAMVAARDAAGVRTPVIEWKYVVFNWNDRREHIERAVSLARAAGVDQLSFWFTLSPLYGISWRYWLAAHMRRLGVRSWKGREIDFTAERSRLDGGA